MVLSWILFISPRLKKTGDRIRLTISEFLTSVVTIATIAVLAFMPMYLLSDIIINSPDQITSHFHQGIVKKMEHNPSTGGTDIYFQRGENSAEYILKTDLQTPQEYWHRNYAVGSRPKILVRCAHHDDVDFFLTRINGENSNRDNMINGALVCNVKNPSKVFK